LLYVCVCVCVCVCVYKTEELNLRDIFFLWERITTCSLRYTYSLFDLSFSLRSLGKLFSICTNCVLWWKHGFGLVWWATLMVGNGKIRLMYFYNFFLVLNNQGKASIGKETYTCPTVCIPHYIWACTWAKERHIESVNSYVYLAVCEKDWVLKQQLLCKQKNV